MHSPQLRRRAFLKLGAAALPASVQRIRANAERSPASSASTKTRFQIACMTLPYSQFTFERALTGIKEAGYEFVALGTTHQDSSGKAIPVIAADAAPSHAKQVAEQCRDSGLKPVMMFSMIYPEAKNAAEILTYRIAQASVAGIPQLLTFGHTEGGDRKLWVERLKKLAPFARDHGVTIVVKQHGGSTGTGAACAEIIREVADEGVKVNYDAGNVMDYLNLDPIADIKKCATEVRSFCIKDHRNFPADQDCGPGFGEIDHYKLLHAVAFSSLTIPLCCENIFAPLLPRPTDPREIDTLARRAREFLEVVVNGLQTTNNPREHN
jgi:sugar phosphate isomerase/epimerase